MARENIQDLGDTNATGEDMLSKKLSVLFYGPFPGNNNKLYMRLPGIEPGLEAVSLLLVKLLPAKGCWEAPVIAAGPQPHIDLMIC